MIDELPIRQASHDALAGLTQYRRAYIFRDALFDWMESLGFLECELQPGGKAYRAYAEVFAMVVTPVNDYGGMFISLDRQEE